MKIDWFLGLCIALLAGLVLWVLVMLFAPITATSTTDAQITGTRPYSTTTYIKVGKLWMPQTHHYCEISAQDAEFRYSFSISGYGEWVRVGATYRLRIDTREFLWWEWEDIGFD